MRHALLGSTLAAAMAGCASACGGSTASPAAPSGQAVTAPKGPDVPVTWDLDALGVPKIGTADYIDLDAIAQISRFRSAEGHSYTDDFETCRSMKHYFRWKTGVSGGTIRIFSPVDGKIAYVRPEQMFGMQVGITPTSYPAFTMVIFHLIPGAGIVEGAEVTSGQQIAMHIGDSTFSDIAIRVVTPRGMALVSWSDAMSDAVFSRYRSRGLSSRAALVISRAQRDANPLSCNGETFTASGTLPQWFVLQ